jgi:hypothetical protein
MIETAKDGFESPLIEAAIGLGVGHRSGDDKSKFPRKARFDRQWRPAFDGLMNNDNNLRLYGEANL